MKASTNWRLIAALVGALALAGCGGGGSGGGGGFPGGAGSGGGGDGNNIPASALQSVDAFIAYMKGLVATAQDSSEPISLGDAVLPVSDSAEAANL